MAKILITGDVHGSPIQHLNYRKIKPGTLTEDDFLIILGDFGVIFGKPCSEERYILDWFNRKPWTTFVVGGNHDDWDRLRVLPYEDTPWGRLQRISHRVFFIPNGTILYIGDRKIFCMGGAMSTDRYMRVEGKNWWAGEIATNEEMQRGVDLLDSVDWNVDYVLTHTMPSECVSKFTESMGYHEDRINDPMARYFSFLTKQGIKFKGWYCGHFHKNQKFGDVNVIYHNIVDLDTGQLVFKQPDDVIHQYPKNIFWKNA